MAVMVDEGSGGNYEPHPEMDGPAVCVDVVDLGWVESTYQGETRSRRMLYVAFYMGQDIEKEIDGELTVVPQLVFKRFTASLHEKANLRKFLERWRGKAFTAAELRGFDVETLVGAPAYLVVEQAEAANGRTYANIELIKRLNRKQHGEPPAYPAGFVRKCDREPEEPTNPAPHEQAMNDEDIPF